MILRHEARLPYAVVLLASALLLFLTLAWGLGVGAVDIGMWDAVTALLAEWGLPVASTATASEERIVLGLRLPRVLLGATSGAALAFGGLLLQGALRTRLAEPVTTGTAAGALLGAAVALFATGRVESGLFDATPGVAALAVRFGLAAVGAAIGTFLVVGLVRSGPRILPGPLLLGGLGVNAVVGAAAAALLFVGSIGIQTAATVVIAWTFGGLLTAAAAPAPSLMAGVLVAAVLLALPLLRPLDLLLLGEEEAVAGGVALRSTRRNALLVASLVVGAAVAAVGVIAFVGLLAPRLTALSVGPAHARALPVVLLLGAVLLVAADTLGRLLAGGGELPAGIIMAAVGAPLLLLLLRRDLQGVSA